MKPINKSLIIHICITIANFNPYHLTRQQNTKISSILLKCRHREFFSKYIVVNCYDSRFLSLN